MSEDTKNEFLKQLEKEKALLEDAKRGVKDIGGGLKARLLEDINEGKVLNRDALLSPQDRMKKRFADMAKARREAGSTGIPEYDRALSKEGAEAVEKARELDPAKKFKTYPKAPETEVDYMKKARKVAEDMEKSDPERVAKEKAARGKELMERAKQSGREMDRKAWIKDPDVGDKFEMRNRDILKTPTATKKAMREGGESVVEKVLKKLGSGAGRKAAGLAIGGPMMLASEMADASEIGVSPRDEIIESTEYSPEEKKALLRGLDMKRKLSMESGDVSQDPTVLRAKEIGRRLQEESMQDMDEDKATAKFMERVSPEDRVKILQDMRKRGLK
jgi:hypothetical protein